MQISRHPVGALLLAPRSSPELFLHPAMPNHKYLSTTVLLTHCAWPMGNNFHEKQEQKTQHWSSVRQEMPQQDKLSSKLRYQLSLQILLTSYLTSLAKHTNLFLCSLPFYRNHTASLSHKPPTRSLISLPSLPLAGLQIFFLLLSPSKPNFTNNYERNSVL